MGNTDNALAIFSRGAQMLAEATTLYEALKNWTRDIK